MADITGLDCTGLSLAGSVKLCALAALSDQEAVGGACLCWGRGKTMIWHKQPMVNHLTVFTSGHTEQTGNVIEHDTVPLFIYYNLFHTVIFPECSLPIL